MRDLIEQVLAGSIGPGPARSAINTMTMRQNNWTLGTYCASYCRVVTTHHALEDRRFSRTSGAPIRGSGRWWTGSKRSTSSSTRYSKGGPGAGRSSPIRLRLRLRRAADELADTLLSHLSYEERELVEPLARLGVLV